MDVLSRPAEEFENDQTLEAMWAMKAFEHAEICFNILSSVDPKLLKLTPVDDTIYKIFREEFPTLDVNLINEDELKSSKGKAKWRPFCERFKNVVHRRLYLWYLIKSRCIKGLHSRKFNACNKNTVLCN